MKVLSDKTAARLLSHLDAAENEQSRHRPRRGAATTPPALLWQIHLDGDNVRIDRGIYFAAGSWFESEPAAVGEFAAGAYVVGRLDGAAIAFSVEPELESAEGPFHLFGRLRETGNSERFVEQYESAPVVFDAHWGAVEPLVELPADGPGSWNALRSPGAEETPSAVAKSYLVDIDLDGDGKVTGLHYRTDTVDSRGNVVAVSERTETPDPDPGEAETPPETPPCGNPLNLGDGRPGPLDDEGGGGGGGGADDDDYNPLDHEGPGGFTPKCAD